MRKLEEMVLAWWFLGIYTFTQYGADLSPFEARIVFAGQVFCGLLALFTTLAWRSE